MFRANISQISYFFSPTPERGLNRGENGCHMAQNSCWKVVLNSEVPKPQCYHSLEGVLANLKYDFFLALKVEFFWDFYISI